MRVHIIGIRALNFMSNGEPIQGTQCFFSHLADGVIGEKADKILVRKGFPLPPELAPGMVVDIFCDTKGRLEHMQVVKSSTER